MYQLKTNQHDSSMVSFETLEELYQEIDEIIVAANKLGKYVTFSETGKEEQFDESEIILTIYGKNWQVYDNFRIERLEIQ